MIGPARNRYSGRHALSRKRPAARWRRGWNGGGDCQRAFPTGVLWLSIPSRGGGTLYYLWKGAPTAAVS